jgi:hypothetical protein
MTAHGHEAVEFTITDWGVGKHSRKNRNQTHPYAKLHHRVSFSAEIKVYLDRGRLLHHAVAQGADLFHVRRHKVVTGFGDPLNIL